MTDFSQRVLGGGGLFPWSQPRPQGGPSHGSNSMLRAAWVLDQMAFAAPENEAGPLQTALRSGTAENLQQAIQRLSATQIAQLRSHVSEPALQEWLSISQERDPELFSESLFHWAQREAVANRLDNAGFVFQLLSQEPVTGAVANPGLRQRAASSLDAMLGRGSLGNRVEFLGRRFAEEAADPVMILGMAAGSLVFSTARTAFLSRLLATPGRGVIGARVLASTGAFLLEVPAFWGTTKGLREAMHPGQQAWDLNTNLREIAGLGLTLGALKLSGAVASGVSGRLARTPNVAEWTATERFGHGFLQQSGTLAGIMLGHRFEEIAGLRRPVDGATNLLDSLAMLLQFHVGGRLSQAAMGPRFQAYTQEMDVRARMLEQTALQNSFSGHPPWGGMQVESPVTVGGPPLAAEAGRGGRRGIFNWISAMMTGDPDGPSGSDKTPNLTAVEPVSERQNDIPTLPTRTGRNKNGSGRIVDRFEPILTPEKLLRSFPEERQVEILEELGFAKNQIPKINEMHLGDRLAMALQNRIRDLVHGPQLFHVDQPLSELSENYRQSILMADELVGIVEYLRRSNDTKALSAFDNSMEPNSAEGYEQLKARLVDYLGPHFNQPQGTIAKGEEVVSPSQAILSIGSGDMMGMLALYRHNIRPGGLSWRTRLFATARDPGVADEINRSGTYRGKVNLRDIQINYANDPKIEAVGPQGHQGLTQERLQRTVALQILNVPSDQLHKVLTPEYVRGLPEHAVLMEVIGGFISHDNLGRYKTDSEERQALLPYQLIERALLAHNRSDVSVVSGGGYIPGKILWWGEPVKMVFASREGEEHYSAPAAELVTQIFAGKQGRNDFLNTSITHHQHSTELGKAMKNVTSLAAGYKSAQMVAAQMERGAMEATDLQGRFETEVRTPLFNIMQGLLVYNEAKINPTRAEYDLKVADDYWRCSHIEMSELVQVVDAARQLNVMDRQALRDFILNRVVNNSRIASTRNPKRGIVQSLYQMWRENGCPYEIKQLLPYEEDGVTPKMTEEGVNSLRPMTEYYDFPSHPIEKRRLHEELYRIYDVFNPDSPILPPLLIPEPIRSALDGNVPTIQPASLRRSLEGSSETALQLLNSELTRFQRLQKVGHRSAELQEEAARQFELVTRLISAMKEGNPVAIGRSPIIRAPYGNLFVIRMEGDETGPPPQRAYLRVEGSKIMDRITQLGMFLRSFPEGTRLLTEVNLMGFDPLQNARERVELEMTIQSILTAFRRMRPEDELGILLGNTRIASNGGERAPPSRQYFTDLAPLVERLRLGAPEGQAPSAQAVRTAGQAHGDVLDFFLQKNPGWPMLLGYFGGPINRAIKSALTRPERGTLIGAYSEGKLVDAFSVYRGDNDRPMVLNHHLLSRLTAEFPTEPVYQNLTSINYFEGMPLDTFLRDYERFFGNSGRASPQYRLLDLRSLPLEEALAGRVEGVNPALLRIYLEGQDSGRAAMLDRVGELYDRPFHEIRPQLRVILNEYLDPFYREHDAMVNQVPLFRYFEKHGSKALARLVRNGDDIED